MCGRAFVNDDDGEKAESEIQDMMKSWKVYEAVRESFVGTIEKARVCCCGDLVSKTAGRFQGSLLQALSG